MSFKRFVESDLLCVARIIFVQVAALSIERRTRIFSSAVFIDFAIEPTNLNLDASSEQRDGRLVKSVELHKRQLTGPDVDFDELNVSQRIPKYQPAGDIRAQHSGEPFDHRYV